MNELITCQLGYKSAKKSQIFLCNIEAFFLLDWMAIPSIIFGASSLSTIMVISIVKTVAYLNGSELSNSLGKHMGFDGNKNNYCNNYY